MEINELKDLVSSFEIFKEITKNYFGGQKL